MKFGFIVRNLMNILQKYPSRINKILFMIRNEDKVNNFYVY